MKGVVDGSQLLSNAVLVVIEGAVPEIISHVSPPSCCFFGLARSAVVMPFHRRSSLKSSSLLWYKSYVESTCALTPVFAIATTDVLPLIDESFRHGRPMLIPNLQRCSKHQFCQHENCKNDFPTGLYPLVGLPTLDCVMTDMLGYSVVRVWLRSGRHCPFMPFF